MNNNELKTILDKHNKWLAGEEDGEKANLRGTDLSRDDLRGANLRGADLCGVDLCEADLSMAKNLLSAITYIKDNFETINEGIIVYKTFGGTCNPPEEWIIQSGSILSENCNMNRTDSCGCGINVAPIEWVKKSYSGDIWKCLIRWEWLCGVCVPYNTDGKIRCEMLELIEVVDRN